MNISIISKAQKNDDYETINSVVNTLFKFDVSVLMLEDYSKDLSGLDVTYCDNTEALANSSDIIIAIGGDGTIMHAAKIAAEFDKPILGVNSGRLGFMASIEQNQIDNLSMLINGNYKISKHMIFEVKHQGNRFFALNDVVINRALDSHIIDYRIYRYSESICGYRADGLIVATPTGSTAYSLSAGGPIVESDMDCMIITPICAHSLYARSMVLNPGEPITVEYSHNISSKVLVSIDGQVCFSDSVDNTLEIQKADVFAKFIILGHNNFYKNIDKKLINKTYL